MLSTRCSKDNIFIHILLLQSLYELRQCMEDLLLKLPVLYPDPFADPVYLQADDPDQSQCHQADDDL
jgi:hypothetical protein